MSDYAKTVKQLRYCSKATVKDCMECEGYKETGDCVSEKLAKDAAEAIEELMAQVRDKDYLIQQQADEIERLRRDVKNQQEKMIELAKKLPKRGEWKTTDAFPHRVYCSNCFRTYVPNDRWQIWVDKPGEGGLERNYCPSCGAKMEVQE